MGGGYLDLNRHRIKAGALSQRGEAREFKLQMITIVAVEVNVAGMAKHIQQQIPQQPTIVRIEVNTVGIVKHNNNCFNGPVAIHLTLSLKQFAATGLSEYDIFPQFYVAVMNVYMYVCM